MKRILRVSVLIGYVLCLLFLFGSTSFAQTDPVSARAECNPDLLTGPYTVKVSIQVSNVGDDDIPGVVTLYDPNGSVVTSFGSNGSTTLPMGQSYAWQGEWAVTADQFNAGKITYKLSYEVYSDEGNRTSKTKSVSATIRKKAPEPDINIRRQYRPENPVAGQTVTMDYIIANTGTVALTNIDIVDEGIGAKTGSLTVARLAVGEQITRSHSFTMGEQAMTSSPVCYFGVEGNATDKYKGDDAPKITITPAQVNISATLTASKQVVAKGEKVELTCVITNQGDLNYEKIKIEDQTLGTVASSIKVNAKKTHTEKKTAVVNASTTFSFIITGTDASGNPLQIKTNEVTVQTLEDAKPVSLEISIAGDRDIIYEERVAGVFIIEVRNTGEETVQNIEVYAGSTRVKTIPSLAAGEEFIFAKEFTLSMGGQYQFSARAKDLKGEEQTFPSNIHRITYQPPAPTPSPTPTLTPSPSPTPTVEPTLPIQNEEDTSGSGFGTILLYVLAALLVVIIGGVAAMFLLERRRTPPPSGPRGRTQTGSVEIIDHMERGSRRDYARAPSAKPRGKTTRQPSGRTSKPEPKAAAPATPKPVSRTPERVFTPLDVESAKSSPSPWETEPELLDPSVPEALEPEDSHRIPPALYQRPQDSDEIDLMDDELKRPGEPLAPEEDMAMRSGSDGQYHLSRRAGSMRPKPSASPQIGTEDPASFARKQRARRGREINLAQFYDDEDSLGATDAGSADDGARRRRRSDTLDR